MASETIIPRSAINIFHAMTLKEESPKPRKAMSKTHTETFISAIKPKEFS
jgi:hypothetical protein